jgi:uncharacterized protein YdaU (DUF1376 family)
MSGARFVRFYPSDWRSGCMGLTPEEEGVYMRACAHGWETGVRLPLDDAAAASRLTLDVRMWRRIKNKLIEKGKLHVASDGIFNPRAEREFEAATRAKQQADAQADMGSARNGHDRQHEDGGSPLAGRGTPGAGVLVDVAEKSPESLGEVSEIFAAKDNEINGPLKEPIARAIEEEKKDSARVDFLGRPIEGPDADVSFDGRTIELINGERKYWLDKFGDNERLDLALIQAAGYILPNSRQPLAKQVRAQLARAAGDKIDRDQRYAAAAQAKPAVAQAARPKNWVDERNDRARALMATLSTEMTP